jgi:hypothetical protein
MTAMWMLPSALRARVALVTLVGLLLVPITTSSLRGLTHVLTCQEAVEASLVIAPAEDESQAAVGSAASVTRDSVDAPEPTLCGGLTVDLELAETRGDRAAVVVAVTNRTTVDWRGSIELAVADVDVPLSIGRIRAGTVARDTVELRVEPDRTYEITGTLLIGP